MRYVGIDAHKNNLQVAILDEDGKLNDEFKVSLDSIGLGTLLKRFKKTDRVLIEATTNAFTLYDIILPRVAQVAVSNPIKTKVIAEARIKTDKIDARTLAQLLRLDAYYPVWVPPVAVRQNRKLVSLYYQIQGTMTRFKNRIHAIFHTRLITPLVKDLFSPSGRAWLEDVELMESDRFELSVCKKVLSDAEDAHQSVVARIEAEAVKDPQVLRLMQVSGINLLSAFIILAEIGDISRFPFPGKLTSYAGLVPSVHQSNQKAYTGRITKAGRRHLRWIMIQVANVAVRYNPQFQGFYQKLSKKKGHNVAVTAVARKLLEVIWHLLAREETYQGVDVNIYLNKLMNGAWKVGKEAYPGGAKQLVSEGLHLLGTDYPEENGKPISLNALRKKKQEAQEWVNKLQVPGRRYVLKKQS